jgi:hypothetical protein
MKRLKEKPMSHEPTATVPGRVEKIVKSPLPNKSDKAQIEIEGTDDEHKRITIENCLEDKDGHEVHLNPGAKVKVTVKPELEEIHFGRHSG